MADQNFIVTTLPDYVEQNRELIIKDVVLRSRTIERIAKQLGIKTSAALNYLGVDPKFQDGKACGFNPQGTVELTQRIIKTGMIAVNMDICPKTLLGKWPEYLVKIGAGREELPFEKYIVDGIIAAIQEKLEKAVWQSDLTSADEDLNKFVGFLKIAKDEQDVIKKTIPAGTSAYESIKQIILALPKDMVNKADIWVAPELFQSLIFEIVEKNYYHYDGNHGDIPNDIVFPGTGYRVIMTEGLAGTNNIFVSASSNMYYGSDLLDNSEVVDIWFSKDDRIFKIDVEWNSGVQVAFPERVMLVTIEEPAQPASATGKDVVNAPSPKAQPASEEETDAQPQAASSERKTK